MSQTIKIINPIPGTAGFTTRRRADRFVQSGIAEYVRPGFLRFTSKDRQALNASICAGVRIWASEEPSETKSFYDWRGEIKPGAGKPCYKPGQVRS
jgi:hypothetical protein